MPPTSPPPTGWVWVSGAQLPLPRGVRTLARAHTAPSTRHAQAQLRELLMS